MPKHNQIEPNKNVIITDINTSVENVFQHKFSRKTFASKYQVIPDMDRVFRVGVATSLAPTQQDADQQNKFYWDKGHEEMNGTKARSLRSRIHNITHTALKPI